MKARMDQLRAEITPEELHAVEVIIDVLADACCTIQAGDGEQDGGNKTVFGKMNAIILWGLQPGCRLHRVLLCFSVLLFQGSVT